MALFHKISKTSIWSDTATIEPKGECQPYSAGWNPFISISLRGERGNYSICFYGSELSEIENAIKEARIISETALKQYPITDVPTR